MTDPAPNHNSLLLPQGRAVRAAKTLAWVLVVTLLIWVYADLEKTEKEDFRARMILRLGAGGDLAMLGGTDLLRQDLEVIFKASGSRGGLDRVGKELSERPGALMADVSDLGPGRHQVSVADRLARAEIVRDAGLTVVSASPALVTVDLDAAIHVADVEVRPRLPVGGGVELAGPPPRVGVTVAKSLWEELTRSGARPVLETEPLGLPPPGADGNTPIRAAVAPFLSGVPVLPDRAFVEVTLKVSQATRRAKLKVPVLIVTPPAWAEDETWERFVLKREDSPSWIPELEFEGPAKEIEKLRPEDVDAYVVLREGDKDTTTSWLTRPVEIRLPRDSQIQVVGPRPSVNLRLDPRPAGSTTPP